MSHPEMKKLIDSPRVQEKKIPNERDADSSESRIFATLVREKPAWIRES